MTMPDAMTCRISIRSYINKPIAKNQTRQIQRIMSCIPRPPFASLLRFELIDLTELSKRQAKELGSIGNVQGAQLFVAGAVQNSPYSLEDYGYCLEYILLKLTQNGFGTCWIAFCHFELTLKELALPGRWADRANEAEVYPEIHYILSWITKPPESGDNTP